MAERVEPASATSEMGQTGSVAAGQAGGGKPATKASTSSPQASTKNTADTGGEGQDMAEATESTTAGTDATRSGAAPVRGKAGAGKGGTKKTAAGGASQAAKKSTSRSATKPAAKSTAKPAAKSTAKSGGKSMATPRPYKSRSAADTDRIREALEERRTELRQEYDQHLAEIAELQRDRLTDSAGDDQADTGSKTFEREQEISLANSILERIKQVERALERLDEGTYGWCERCGDAIPVERLAAFPSATLCVTCKQLEERR
jgi:RNA polymerase-binding protein DksA